MTALADGREKQHRFGHAVRRVDERLPGAGLPLLSVSQVHGVVRRELLTDAPARAESLDAYKVCRAGDIVFNKMTIRAGAMGAAHEDGLVTYHYEVMRPRPGFDGRYLVYLMKSASFTSELIQRERGIGAGSENGRVRTTEVPFSSLRTIPVHLPELVEQERRAEFLDRETAQIDALIDDQERFISLLLERRRVAVENALWRHADPLDPSASLPPEGWQWTRVKRVASLEAGGTPDTDDDRYWDLTSSGTPWVAIGDMSGRDVVGATARGVSSAGLAAKRLPVRGPGTLLFAMYASVGEVARLEREAAWNQALLGITPRPGVIELEFLQAALSSLRPRLPLLYRSSTQNNLNAYQVANLVVPLPPIETQRHVVADLRAKTSRVDALVAKTQEHIALAKERRAALVTAAVTGQIDVTWELD